MRTHPVCQEVTRAKWDLLLPKKKKLGRQRGSENFITYTIERSGPDKRNTETISTPRKTWSGAVLLMDPQSKLLLPLHVRGASRGLPTQLVRTLGFQTDRITFNPSSCESISLSPSAVVVSLSSRECEGM